MRGKNMAVTNIVYPYVFEGGEKAVASEVNADFDQVKIFANSVITEINAINQAIADLEEKPTREMFDIYFSIKGKRRPGRIRCGRAKRLPTAKSFIRIFGTNLIGWLGLTPCRRWKVTRLLTI